MTRRPKNTASKVGLTCNTSRFLSVFPRHIHIITEQYMISVYGFFEVISIIPRRANHFVLRLTNTRIKGSSWNRSIERGLILRINDLQKGVKRKSPLSGYHLPYRIKFSRTKFWSEKIIGRTKFWSPSQNLVTFVRK